MFNLRALAPIFGLVLAHAVCAMPAAAGDSDERQPSKKVMKILSKSYNCDKDDLSMKFMREDGGAGATLETWVVEGCGEPFWVTYNSGILREISMDRKLRQKAPFDLDCPAEDIEYTFIDKTNRGVEGCGKRVTYVYLWGPGEWVANVQAAQ